MGVLSAAEKRFWEQQGYVIVPQAVPEDYLERAVRAISDFQGVDLGRPESWYRSQPENQMKELNRSGMVEFYHHQSLWDIRQYPRVHQAFVEIWGSERLWVTIDRVNLNPPHRHDWDFRGFIHWDVDTSIRPVEFGVQGVLSLTDTPAEQGGFQCVPGFPLQFDSWVATQPVDRDPWKPDLTGLRVEPIPTRAGDLLIWHSLLPHGTAANHGSRPRIAQYLSMFPAREDDETLRLQRVRQWQECLSPEGFAFPGNDRERAGCQPARLTSLGRKLLGLDAWGGAG